MSPRNGQVLEFARRPVGEDTEVPAQDTGASAPVKPSADGLTFRQFGLSLIPLTPVPFTGNKALFAYLRLGIYATASYLTFTKARKLSYVMMGALALSALTSLSSETWNKNGGNQ